MIYRFRRWNGEIELRHVVGEPAAHWVHYPPETAVHSLAGGPPRGEEVHFRLVRRSYPDGFIGPREGTEYHETPPDPLTWSALVYRRVRIVNPPFPIRLEVVDPPLQVCRAPTLNARIRVPGQPVEIVHHLPLPELRHCQIDPIELIYSFLGRVVAHELAECFHVDGQRARDPHV